MDKDETTRDGHHVIATNVYKIQMDVRFRSVHITFEERTGAEDMVSFVSTPEFSSVHQTNTRYARDRFNYYLTTGRKLFVNAQTVQHGSRAKVPLLNSSTKIWTCNSVPYPSCDVLVARWGSGVAE